MPANDMRLANDRSGSAAVVNHFTTWTAGNDKNQAL